MVIEMLTFDVEPDERAAWMAAEHRVWSTFLERQPGFVRKEMWVAHDDDTTVHAVIWWESMEQWKAISEDTVAKVDAELGEWFREPTMRVFEMVREG